MAKQTFTTGQVLTAAQMTSLQQTAMLGGAASAKTASYTLVAADAGTAISMSNASATTITVNTALFSAGDTVQITNLGAGVCTITAGTATVNSSASLALAQYESGTLDFTSTSAAIFIKGAGAAAASGGMTLISETVASALSSLTFSSLGSYKQLLLIYDGLFYSANGVFALRFNNDSGSNYVNQALVISNNAASNNASTTTYVSPNWSIFGQSVTSATEHQRLRGYITIDNYTSSTKRKAYYGSSSWKDNQYNEVNSVNYVGSYNSTTAITSLDIVQVSGTPTLSNTTDTTIRLYGLS